MFYLKEIVSFKYQFVNPSPKGSELIISAPFRAGVFRDNQFTV
jgi:hypothetical protein